MNYKQTEIGLIPEDWEVVRLGDYITLFKEKNKNNFPYPVFTVSNKYGFVLSNEFFNKKVYSKNLSTYKIVKKDFFAYNPYRINVGSISLFKKEIGLVSPAYVVFEVDNDKIYPEFLLLLLKTDKYISEIKRFSMSRGSVRRSLNFKDLSEFKIPLPPLPEQKAIATVLDKIRQAIEQTEEVIKAYKEFKKSLMKYLFTYGVVPLEESDKVKLKETEIGLIPENWEVDKFDNLIEKRRVKVEKIKQRDYKEFGKYPIVDQSQKLIAGYCDKEENIYKGTLPVIIFGDHTRVFKYINFPFVLGADGVKIIIPNYDIIYPKYFYFALLNLKIPNRGYNRHYSLLKEFKIPLPPIDEQKQIAEILNKIDQKIETEENKKEALEKLFKTLLNKLMTGQIRLDKQFIAKFQ